MQNLILSLLAFSLAVVMSLAGARRHELYLDPRVPDRAGRHEAIPFAGTTATGVRPS